MRLIKVFAVLLMLSVVCMTASAVVAKPGPVDLMQPDGTVKQVYLHGDEFFHYMTDASGKVFRMDASGYLKSFSVSASDLQLARQKREKRVEEMRPLLAGSRMTKGGAPFYHNGLVILVNFADNSFSVENPRDAFSRMLNEEGYSERGGTGSARDYYVDNSCGQFIPSFDVYGPYTLPHDMEYYGGNDEDGSDKDPWQMAIDAVDAVYAAGVNLSDYDNDKDGILDYVYIYYAGYGEAYGAESKTIWPHASTMYYHEIEKGGVRYGDYACSCELIGTYGTDMDNIGAFCHEFGHVLGLVDLYDTDYEGSGGQSTALGDLSLMSSGSYNNDSRTPPCLIAEERSMLGWLELRTLTEGTYSLPPIAANEAYCLATDNDGEYFVFENRKKEGWDKYIYDNGMLIYHVDKSANVVYDGQTAAALWSSNGPNIYPVHECMKVMPADGSSLQGASFPGSGNMYTSFTAYTTPPARAWSKMPLKLELSEIKLESDGNVSFTASKSTVQNELMGKVTDFYSNPVSGATLTLIPQSGGSALTAYTDEGGTYLFGEAIASGEYILCCDASDYEQAKQAVTVGDASLVVDFHLMKAGEKEFKFSWASGSLYSIVGSDESFSVAAIWEPGDISLEKKTAVRNVGVYIYEGKPDITAKVYVDKKLCGEKTLSSSNVSEDAYNVVDFSDLNIVYDNTQSLQIILLFSGFSGVCYLGMDAGPAVAGKGDLFGNAAGGELASLSESYGYDYNWMLYATLECDPIVSLEDGLVCLSGQRSMYLEWSETGERWSCTYTGDGQTCCIDTLTQPRVLLEGLKPGASYVVDLEGFSADGTKVAAYSFTHKMTAAQNRPMFISYLASYFKSEGRMLLEVYNVPDNAVVTWFVDGKEYNEPLLDSKSVAQTVEAHVYISASEGTEIIRRKVTASSKSSLVDGGASGAGLPKPVRKKL